jgi:hypothetical protein
MEFVIIEYLERREVFVNNESQGFNKDENGEYNILQVGSGRQNFHLGEPKDYTPSEQTVVVQDTDPIDPLQIVFSPLQSDFEVENVG